MLNFHISASPCNMPHFSMVNLHIAYLASAFNNKIPSFLRYTKPTVKTQKTLFDFHTARKYTSTIYDMLETCSTSL